MKDVDKMLARHRPIPERQLHANFTNNVTDAIEKASHAPQFLHVLHVLQDIYAKLSRLPKFALVVLAIIAAGMGTTVTYAAITWLLPTIKVLTVSPSNDDDKREFVMNINNCGVMVGGQTADNGTQRFEVAKDAGISDEQVIKVITNSCKYQQLLRFGPDHWKDGSNYGAGAGNVTNDPPIGTVTALSDSQITIMSTIYRTFDGPSSISPGEPIPEPEAFYTFITEGKTLMRTFTLASNADVLSQGNIVPRRELKVGDTVFFMSAGKNPTDPSKIGDTHGLPSTVVHLIKTDIDPTYVQPMQIGDPSIINTVTRLVGCQGNDDYLCIDSYKQGLHGKTFYATAAMEMPAKDLESFAQNAKYARTDINTNSPDSGKYFHHIEGRITKIDRSTMMLRSRGKAATFTVTLPYDAVKTFNQHQGQKPKVAVGNYITLGYLQKTDEDPKRIQSGDLISAVLILRQLGDGSYVKY